MNRWKSASIIALIGVTACTTTFSGVKIIQPQIGSFNSPTVVESLQPVLRWEPSPQADVTYDVVIYEGIKAKSSSERMVGKLVYYRENLGDTRHKIEEPLKPNQEYYWSVRVRRGNAVSNWSLYNYFAFYGVGYSTGRNLPFLFKTPEQ